MTLAHRAVEPALWLDDAPNRMTVASAAAAWAAKHQARGDADDLRWWNEEAPAMIVSRRRSTMADPDLLDALCDV